MGEHYLFTVVFVYRGCTVVVIHECLGMCMIF